MQPTRNNVLSPAFFNKARQKKGPAATIWG